MNAVNLIPHDSRRAGSRLTASPQTIGLIGGLVIVLIGAILYVSASNTVTSRSRQLVRLNAGVQAWATVANGYAPFVTAAAQREEQLAQVRSLVASRFPWSDLLSQIGTMMPAAAELSSLQAATAATTTGLSTPGATTAASAATPATVPTVQLQGCAKDQATVAQTMTQLHEIRDVSEVTLASTSTSGTTGGGASTGASSSSGCGSSVGLPVQFQISLTFSTGTSTGAAVAGSNAPAGGTTGSATPEASTGSASSGASAQ